MSTVVSTVPSRCPPCTTHTHTHTACVNQIPTHHHRPRRRFGELVDSAVVPKKCVGFLTYAKAASGEAAMEAVNGSSVRRWVGGPP